MRTKQFRNRIVTDSDTTVVTDKTCAITQIVIAVQDDGSSWTLRILDKGSPALTLIPETTLAAPTTPAAIILNFQDPVRMEGGIDIVTTGTAGELGVWINAVV